MIANGRTMTECMTGDDEDQGRTRTVVWSGVGETAVLVVASCALAIYVASIAARSR